MTGSDHVPQFLNLSTCTAEPAQHKCRLLQPAAALPVAVSAITALPFAWDRYWTAASPALATKIYAAATCGLAISNFGFRYIK